MRDACKDILCSCIMPTSTHPPTCSCVPGPLSAEAGLIYAQGALLVARSLLTDYLSIIEGRAGRWIIQQVWRFCFLFTRRRWASGRLQVEEGQDELRAGRAGPRAAI